ncbi:MAG: excinuclease ABC subunit UvrA [Firmicutes bacterium]|nr:excinuclease ABC subunit UvrA [Bacillota bacterium]
MDKIVIRGARENNLKNIDLELPKNKLIVMTGVSGSGKSSLAFDTIYAEGERRYVESLSAYARQFIGNSEKPDVDSIEGLSPSISIDQKTTNKNPRSTVGTITELYDYLRLLFSRIGIPYCPYHKIPIKSQSIEEMTNKVLDMEEGTKIEIFAPVIRGAKGTHKDLIDDLRSKGFTKIKINGVMYSGSDEINLAKNIKDDIFVLIDKLPVKSEERSRIFEAIETSCKMANGLVIIRVNDEEDVLMSENYACPYCNFSISELEPRMFSFNSPYGACDDCKGLGTRLKISEDLIIPDKNKSINKGAIVAINLDNNMYISSLKTVAEHYNIDLDIPISEMSRKDLEIILYGTNDIMDFHYVAKNGSTRNTKSRYEGIVNNLERRYIETNSSWIREWIEGFMVESTCNHCKGTRLKEEILSVKINNKSIYDMTTMAIDELYEFVDNLKLNNEEKEISNLLLKEILSRLNFLKNVGLNYLTLARNAATLSGGEAQRIRLATQIGSRLSGVLYVLDEPSIGLHQRDNEKLINSLKEMRDLGNTLIVVEHDTDTMLEADYLVDVGPGAGDNGGYIVAKGTPEEVMQNDASITGRYLSGKERIEIPKKHRNGNGLFLEVKGAKENNLNNINVKFPLNKFIVVTGVSGSGKSTLVNEILYKTLHREFYKSKDIPGKCREIKGIENVDKVVNISQDAIGRTPRSNPATYVGVFDDIRDVFANMKDSKIRGYDKSRFSFNVKGGRCEACWGDGVKKIEMHFLPDVYVPCDVCGGKRYNRETLDVKFKEKSISDVLDMRVSEAIPFFENIPKVRDKLQVMYDVGLSYITLGQGAPTLSGGEAGRVKLAKELQKKATGKSVFILDEPTTGLHSADIKKLLEVLNRIVDNGDTVIVIEHNLDVIKQADYVIDLGPEGGKFGGNVIITGTPEDVAKCEKSYTGQFLKKIFAKEK